MLRGGFCNQLSQKIGVVYGNPETTTGGNALKFYCSVRLDIRRKQALKRGDEVIGSQCKVQVVKNKLAPPFREAEFRFTRSMTRPRPIVVADPRPRDEGDLQHEHRDSPPGDGAGVAVAGTLD